MLRLGHNAVRTIAISLNVQAMFSIKLADGSFDIAAIIPGQYILVAIDHGWDINWSDPSTLNHYLTNGVPLDLRTPTSVKQNIEAQVP